MLMKMSNQEGNKVFAKLQQVRLTDHQIDQLLSSGCTPQFRSLAGILQDAAELGARCLYNDIVS